MSVFLSILLASAPVTFEDQSGKLTIEHIWACEMQDRYKKKSKLKGYIGSFESKIPIPEKVFQIQKDSSGKFSGLGFRGTGLYAKNGYYSFRTRGQAKDFSFTFQFFGGAQNGAATIVDERVKDQRTIAAIGFCEWRKAKNTDFNSKK